jgi:histidinol-phosphatase (PHP family)
MIPLDYHMHSTFSYDGDSSPEAMCRRAIELSLPEIGFSEHWDVGPYEETPRFLRPGAWWDELDRLRSLFAGQLILRAGIEIAEPHLYTDETAEIISRLPFDYVLGSVHYVGEHLMFEESYFRQYTADEVYHAYFAEMDRMVRSADIDIIAHFDIPARTAKPILGYDPTRYEDAIRAILAIVIERGLALDVNVAGLRKPAQNLMPDPLILRWYAEMGGERITFGSDAHSVNHLGLNLDRALLAVREAGLASVTQFEQRQARLIPLDR